MGKMIDGLVPLTVPLTLHCRYSDVSVWERRNLSFKLGLTRGSAYGPRTNYLAASPFSILNSSADCLNFVC